ncbi:MAG: PAS domain S-box protein [Thermodesulfobacteriota bacterium]
MKDVTITKLETEIHRGSGPDGPEETDFLTRVIESSPIGIILTDTEGRVRMVNKQAQNIFGLNRAKISQYVDQAPDAFIAHHLGRVFQETNLPFHIIAKTKNAVYGIERAIETLEGQRLIVTINSAPFKDRAGRITGIISIVEDTTDHKLAEEDREKLVRELTNQSRQLTELNNALRALVTQREKDKEELEEKVMSNLNNSVFPYLEKLSNSRLSGDQLVFLDIAISNLTSIFSSFGSSLAAQFTQFTPRELQVATLIRQGRSNKDIADLLHLSVRSVESHRRSIRKKLGLTRVKTNLRSYLVSMK